MKIICWKNIHAFLFIFLFGILSEHCMAQSKADSTLHHVEKEKPSYSGGMSAFREYVRINMWKVLWALRNNLSDGRSTYNLVFSMDKKGKMYDLKVNQLQSIDPIYRGFRHVFNFPKMEYEK